MKKKVFKAALAVALVAIPFSINEIEVEAWSCDFNRPFDMRCFANSSAPAGGNCETGSGLAHTISMPCFFGGTIIWD